MRPVKIGRASYRSKKKLGPKSDTVTCHSAPAR